MKKIHVIIFEKLQYKTKRNNEILSDMITWGS